MSRALAASIGAYAAASLVAAFVGRLWPGAPVDGATVAMLLAPFVVAGLAVWSFAAARPARTWAAVGVAALAASIGLILLR